MFSIRENIFSTGNQLPLVSSAPCLQGKSLTEKSGLCPYTPHGSTQQLWDHQWSLVEWKRLCKKHNTSPSFSLVPGKENGESPCSPWHRRVLSVPCGTATGFLCTTFSGEERQSNQILHAQILLFKTGPQTLRTLRYWELMMKWTQGHAGWERWV